MVCVNTYLFGDALAEQHHLDALFGVQFCEAHIQYLKIQGIVALVHIELSIAAGIKDAVKRLIGTAFHGSPGVTRAGVNAVKTQVSRVGPQPLPDLIRELVVAHLGVEDNVKGRESLRVALARVRVEFDRLLVQQEIVVFPRIFESIRAFDAASLCQQKPS
jgi:hypothetical protein